ncbi:hypothetical protein ACFLRO_00240 [Bacteroidota bacterium]
MMRRLRRLNLVPRPLVMAIIGGLGLLVLVSGEATSQSRASGSVYGGFGIGERRSIYSSQAQGMGVLGVGLFTPAYLNLSNPGAYSDQVFTRFAGGMDFTGVRSTDAASQSSTSASGNIGSIQFGFPIMTRKLGFAASYGPYTNAGYRATTFGVLESDGSEPGTLYETNFEGSGGIQEANFGFGYKFSRGFSIGVSGSALWGITGDAVRTEYGNVSDFVSSAKQRVSTRLNGFTGSAGFVLRSPRVFGSNDVLTFGGSFVLPTSLSGARTQFVNQGLTLSDTVGAAIDIEANIPMRIQAGITYTPNQKWLIAADGRYEPWSTFEGNRVFRGYDPNKPAVYNDAYRIGIGAQFIAAGNDPFAGKLARTALRFGFFTERAYAAPQTNYKLVTYGLSGGLSIPTALPGTYLDLAGQIGTRGESQGILVKDLLYKISVTLNFGERWFIQRRLR